tara:strand:- start:331 stop:600 length:270 start_codon:yes stop_codon:yes gene_type:complete
MAFYLAFAVPACGPGVKAYSRPRYRFSRTACPRFIGSQTSHSSPLSLSRISPHAKRPTGIAAALAKLVGPHATMPRWSVLSLTAIALED